MALKIIAELEPTKNRDKLLRRVEKLVANVDSLDIPEVPMGKPIASAAVLAAHLKAIYPQVGFIPHIRVIDVNRVGLLSLVGGLTVALVDEVVFLRGDPPVEGVTVEDLTVEEAAALVKKKLRKRPQIGAMLSIRYSLDAIEKRISSDIDFFMVLRALYNLEKLVQVSKVAHSRGKKLYAYIIVASSRNQNMLRSMLGDQPVYSVEEVEDVAEKLEGIVDGVVLSSPGDSEALIDAAQRLYRRF